MNGDPDHITVSAPARSLQVESPAQTSQRLLFPEKNVAILHLQARETVILEGTGLLCVAYGSCSILGATIRPKATETYYPIISAPYGPFSVSLTAVLSSQDAKRALIDYESKIVSKAIASLLAEIGEHDCLLLFRTADTNLGLVSVAEGSKCPRWVDDDIGRDYHIFARSILQYLPHLSLTLRDDGDPIVAGLHLARLPLQKFPAFTYWSEWPEFCGLLNSFMDTKPQKAIRLLVTGARGAGKSMLSRAAVNYLLTRFFPAVIYIETDVGQPELNPPGLIAAHIVRVPLLGVPAARNRSTPFSAQFFGAPSPSFNPAAYCHGVRRVVQDARALSSAEQLPIVVNSHGWVSGTGLDLVREIVGQLEPTLITTLRFPQTANALPPLCGASHRTASFSITSTNLASQPTAIPASNMRELHFCSYFGAALRQRSLDQCAQTGKVFLFRIKLQNLAVRILGEGIKTPCLLMALNGAIVGLAAVGDNWRCVGLGLVRAVCPSSGEIFLSTPLDKRLIQTVSGIMLTSGLEIPQSLLKGVAQDGDIPYVLKDCVTNSLSIKARGSLRRRSHQ